MADSVPERTRRGLWRIGFGCVTATWPRNSPVNGRARYRASSEDPADLVDRVDLEGPGRAGLDSLKWAGREAWCFRSRAGRNEWASAASNADYGVFQRADAADADADAVAFLQREIVRRHDAGAGQQHRAVGEALAAIQPFRQFAEGAADA